MSSAELGRFLRAHRDQLNPDELELRSHTTRRTQGLRREEVAELAGVSTDYYRRLEQARVGPPSAQVLEALSRALRLTVDEREYAYRIVDREPPRRPRGREQVDRALLQMLDAMPGAAAMVTTMLGETLAQNAAARSLLGDHSRFTGNARNTIYRWFTDPAERALYPADEHEEESAARVATLRGRYARSGDPRAERLIAILRARSREFERHWSAEKVAICRSGPKRLLHSEAGVLDLQAQILEADGPGQLLVTFTAPVGTPAAAKLQTLDTSAVSPATRREDVAVR